MSVVSFEASLAEADLRTSRFGPEFLSFRLARLTPCGTLAMWPPSAREGFEVASAGQELNIAQDARRQAAQKAARLRAFSVEQSNRRGFPATKGEGLHADD